jgi:hypothetical protein
MTVPNVSLSFSLTHINVFSHFFSYYQWRRYFKLRCIHMIYKLIRNCTSCAIRQKQNWEVDTSRFKVDTFFRLRLNLALLYTTLYVFEVTPITNTSKETHAIHSWRRYTYSRGRHAAAVSLLLIVKNFQLLVIDDDRPKTVTLNDVTSRYSSRALALTACTTRIFLFHECQFLSFSLHTMAYTRYTWLCKNDG